MPSKKQKKRFGNYIGVIETKTLYFVLVVLTKADKNESPYAKPIVSAFEEDDSGELSEQWKVIKIVHMKGNKIKMGRIS